MATLIFRGGPYDGRYDDEVPEDVLLSGEVILVEGEYYELEPFDKRDLDGEVVAVFVGYRH